MMGNYHVRFLEGKAPERGLTYSIYKSTKTVVRVNSEQLFLFKSPIYINRQIISSFESK